MTVSGCGLRRHQRKRRWQGPAVGREGAVAQGGMWAGHFGGLGLAHPMSSAAWDRGHGLAGQAVDHGEGGRLLGQQVCPWFNGPWLGAARLRHSLGGGHQPEQGLGAGEVEMSEPEPIPNAQFGPQELVGDFAGGVRRQTQVGELVTGRHSGMARSHQSVGLPSLRGADEVNVFVGPDPLQGGQAVEGGLGVVLTRGATPPGHFRACGALQRPFSVQAPATVAARDFAVGLRGN